MTENINFSGSHDRGDRAVVVGGSIAGLLSARVLSDYFREVVLVDRDQFPGAPVARKGVPQSVQPHILLTKGYRVLQELFPGIEQDFIAAGAITIDWAREFHLFIHGEWMMESNTPSPYLSVTCSRSLLEWVIRKRLTCIRNVRFLERSRVIGLQYEPPQQQVSGVFIQDYSSSADTIRLTAQLVVNASGRGSQSVKWLADIGFSTPPATVINPKVGYATQRYRVSESGCIPWKVMLINHEAPSQTRLGYLAKIEEDEWIATLGGYSQDYPPLDNAGFQAFARTLSNPEFFEFIQKAKPTSPIYAFRSTTNRLYHYERIILPRGYITLGDALCSLCPVHGQGMTVSGISALILQDWLRKTIQVHKTNQFQFYSAQLQKQLAAAVLPPWLMATGQDSRFEATLGAVKPKGIEQIITQYFDRLILKSRHDPKIHSLIIEVGHMLKSTTAFFHPSILLRVIL